MKILIIFLCIFVFNSNVMASVCSPYLTSIEIPGEEISPIFHKYQNTYTTTATEIETINYILENSNAEVEINTRNNIFGTSSAVIQVSCNDNVEEYEIILSGNEEQVVFKEVINDQVIKYNNQEIFIFVMSIIFIVIIIIAFVMFPKRKK